MSTPYLALTDGTTTIEIMNGNPGANYAIYANEWAPNIAPRRRSVVGGRGIVEDVVEELNLRITDTTAAACYTRLKTLQILLDQADDLDNDRDATPVYIHYAPGGSGVSSSSTPLKALILRRATGDETHAVQLSPEFQQATYNFAIENIKVRVVRRGEWLLSDQTVSSSATTNGDVVDMNLSTATDNPSPTDISLSKVVLQTTRAFLIVSDEQKIDVLAAEGGDDGGAYDSVTDAGKLPRNTNILRYTPAGTTEDFSATITTTGSTGVQLTTGIFAFFANIRNNSSSTSYRARMKLVGSGPDTYTPYVYIPPYSGSAYPEWQCLGLAYSRQLVDIAIGLTASAGSGTIDIDTFVVVNLSRSHTQIIRTTLSESGSGSYLSGSSALFAIHLLDPSAAFEYPIVGSTNGSSFIPHTVDGDPVFMMKAAHLYGVFLATAADNNLDRWRQENSGAAGTALTNVWTATRTIGYIAPI